MTIEINGKEYTAKDVGLEVLAAAQAIESQLNALKRKLGLMPPTPNIPQPRVPDVAIDASEEEQSEQKAKYEKLIAEWSEKYRAACESEEQQALRDAYYLKCTPEDEAMWARLRKVWVSYCKIFLIDTVGVDSVNFGYAEDIRVQSFFVNVLGSNVKKLNAGGNGSSSPDQPTASPQNSQASTTLGS